MTDVARIQSVLTAIGDQPNHDSVDSAKAKLAGVVDSRADVTETGWGESGESACYPSAGRVASHIRTRSYSIKDAEERLVRIYRLVKAGVVEEDRRWMASATKFHSDSTAAVIRGWAGPGQPLRLRLTFLARGI